MPDFRLALAGGTSIDQREPGIAHILVIGSALFLLFFSWVTPNHYQPWLSFHGELAAAVGGLIGAAWIIFGMNGPTQRIPRIAAGVLLASLIPLAQLAFGLVAFGGDALLVAMYVAGLGLAQLIGFKAAASVDASRAMAPMAWTVLVGSLWSVGLALYQWQGLGFLEFAVIGITDGMRPYANLIQPNQLATLLVLGLLSATYLFEIGKLNTVVCVVVLLAGGFGVAMTLSRVGLLEVLIAAAVLLARRTNVTNRRLTRIRVLIGVALVLAMQFAWHEVQGKSPMNINRSSTELSSAGTRPLHWQSMLDAIGRKPLTGWGAEGVSEAQYTVSLDHPASHETIGYSHNLVLDLLVWTGVPIGLGLTIALAWWFWRAWRNVRDAGTLVALCFVITGVVHALVEFPLYYTYFLLPIGYVMGIVGFVTMPSATFKVPRWLAPTVLAAVAAATTLVAVDYFRLESDVRNLRFSQAHIGPHWSSEQHTKMRALTQLEHFWTFANQPEHRHMSEVELNETRAVVKRFPARNNILHLAVALALNGKPAEAAEHLSRACAINPESSCDFIKAAWEERSNRDPELKAVPWPASSTH